MSRSFNGSSDYIEHGAAVVSGEPCTLAGWFNSASITISQVIVAVGTAAGTARYQLTASGAIAGDPVAATSITSAGTPGTASSSTGYSANTWHHAAGVFGSSNSRAAYIDGGSKATNATGITVTGLDVTNIGSRYASGVNGAFFDGILAEIGIWNASLTDAEVLSLARGYSPRHIRPQSLVFYAPLVRELIDLKGNALSATGTTVADHYRIIV